VVRVIDRVLLRDEAAILMADHAQLGLLQVHA